MLSKKHHLPTSFFRARKRPIQSFHAGGMGVRVYETVLPYPRCAVVVPVKTAKNAVERNKIRRMVYDAVRIHITKISAYDIVFFVSDKENLKENLLILLEKISRL